MFNVLKNSRVILRFALISIVFSTFFIGISARKDFVKSEKIVFALDLQANRAGTAEIFFDTGTGFRQEQSKRIHIIESNEILSYRFPIDAAGFEKLRFDPIDGGPATISIRNVRLEDASHKIIKKIPINDLLEYQQIKLLESDSDAIKIKIDETLNYPIFLIRNSGYHKKFGFGQFLAESYQIYLKKFACLFATIF